jgi:hypothetical protein
MIVVIGGMPRSGSTWSFNIARKTLDAKNSRILASAENTLPSGWEIFVQNPCQHLILKTHFPDSQILGRLSAGKAKGVATTRDLQGAVSSWQRTFSLAPEPISAWQGWYPLHQHHFLEIGYSQVGSLSAILKIQGFLLGKRSPLEAVLMFFTESKIRNRLRVKKMRPGPGTTDIGFSFYDSKTFYHRDHITS